jgi:hypothetical protein
MEQKVKVFTAQDYQKPFFESVADFPCRVGPWGDGKTLCMIMMGMTLSQLYPHNEGLIIRKRYNSLQRSTIRDFEDWTGLKVPEQKKSVVVPGCGSVIHFAHCEDMAEFKDGIQGMNLGWVAIEQADELETSDIFDMFFGRIRRVLTPIARIQQALVDYGLMKEVVDDWKVFDSDQRDVLEKAIKTKLRLPVRQFITIANACGHNWIWKLWNPASKTHMGIEDGFDYSEGKPFENKLLPKDTNRRFEILKRKPGGLKKYNRYVLNSHEDYDIEGSYYAELMSDALKEKRVERINLYDKGAPVYTFWDLGIRGNHSTSIWFVQFIAEKINVINFYSNYGKGMNHYSEILDEKKYHYDTHYLPHDAKSGIQGKEVTTRYDILRNLRGRNEDIIVTYRSSLADTHEAVYLILPHCWFDEKCEKGVEALNHYRRAINRAKSTWERTHFLDTPEKDENSHPADAFGQVGVVHKYYSIGGMILGSNRPSDENEDVIGVTDLLEVA